MKLCQCKICDIQNVWMPLQYSCTPLIEVCLKCFTVFKAILMLVSYLNANCFMCFLICCLKSHTFRDIFSPSSGFMIYFFMSPSNSCCIHSTQCRVFEIGLDMHIFLIIITNSLILSQQQQNPYFSRMAVSNTPYLGCIVQKPSHNSSVCLCVTQLQSSPL